MHVFMYLCTYGTSTCASGFMTWPNGLYKSRTFLRNITFWRRNGNINWFALWPAIEREKERKKDADKIEKRATIFEYFLCFLPFSFLLLNQVLHFSDFFILSFHFIRKYGNLYCTNYMFCTTESIVFSSCALLPRSNSRKGSWWTDRTINILCFPLALLLQTRLYFMGTHMQHCTVHMHWHIRRPHILSIKFIRAIQRYYMHWNMPQRQLW